MKRCSKGVVSISCPVFRQKLLFPPLKAGRLEPDLLACLPALHAACALVWFWMTLPWHSSHSPGTWELVCSPPMWYFEVLGAAVCVWPGLWTKRKMQRGFTDDSAGLLSCCLRGVTVLTYKVDGSSLSNNQEL